MSRKYSRGITPQFIDIDFLRKCMEQQLVYLSYLQPDGILSTSKKWLMNILLLSQICISLRFLVLLFLDPNQHILNFIVDQNARLGQARNYFHTVGLLWVVASNYSGWKMLQSQKDPSRQRWIGISEALRTYRFHGYGEFRNSVKFGIIFNQIFIISSAIISFLYVIPFFLWAEPKFWIFGLAVAFHQAVCGTMVASWNMAPLYCLHMYLFGQVYKFQVRDLRLISDHNFNSILSKWIKTIQDVNNAYNFYKPSNESAFCSTFAAQILIVYFVFFANISDTFKLVFGMYFVLNHVAGQSIHFFFSAYAQNMVSL